MPYNKKPKNYWTKERIIEEAKKFSHPSDWKKHSSTSYSYSFKEGVYEEASSHMVKNIGGKGIKKSKKHWPKEKRQKTWGREGEENGNWKGGIFLKDKKEYHRQKYSRDKKESLDLLKKGVPFDQIPNAKRNIPRSLWPKEEVVKESQKSKEVRSKKKKNPKPNKYGSIKINYENLSLKDCQVEAAKYKTRSQMGGAKGYAGSVYRCIKQKNWEKECFQHMKIPSGVPDRCIYVCEFPKNNKAYVGLTCEPERRFLFHQGKENNKRIISPVYQFFLESGEFPNIKILTNFLPAEKAQEEEGRYIELYKTKKWNMLNKAKAGGLGGMKPKWTKERFLKDRRNNPNLKTIKEFYSLYPKWVKAIVTRKGWKKEVEEGLLGVPLVRWSKEKVEKAALSCENKTDLRKRFKGAYNFAARNEFLKELKFRENK